MLASFSTTRTIRWSPKEWPWLTRLLRLLTSTGKWTSTKAGMPPDNNSSSSIILNTSITSKISSAKMSSLPKDSCTRTIKCSNLNKKGHIKWTAPKKRPNLTLMKQETVPVLQGSMSSASWVAEDQLTLLICWWMNSRISVSTGAEVCTMQKNVKPLDFATRTILCWLF